MDPMKPHHHGHGTHLPGADVEKTAATDGIHLSPSSGSLDKEAASLDNTPSPAVPVPRSFKYWNTRIESLAGLEARGITRVMPEERHAGSAFGYVNIAILWFSANITANNLAVGLLGPLLFNLGFVDSTMMAVWGCLLGSAVVAYTSIWGAQSGNRTMVSTILFCAIFAWPSRTLYS
jgi:hypothetical protein